MEKKEFIENLKRLNVEKKGAIELYQEISALAMQYGMREERSSKTACYLSMEFLVGRGFYNNLMELGVLEEVKTILAEKGVCLDIFEQIEDSALGNGGLGRLAACFLDSASGVNLPLCGYGIRYRYGLFQQAFENGFQVELPDDWQRFGDPWSIRREEERQEIEFADMTVTAVPYDMPIFGKRVNILRLYQAEGSEKAQRISAYLYPSDENEEGKLLRLRQEYFFSACAVRDRVKLFVKKQGERFELFPQTCVFQLNDTHPVLAVAEFIRLLTADYGVDFQMALSVARNAFAYTNHTVLPEALEKWDKKLVAKILPDIAGIIECIACEQENELKSLGCSQGEIEDMAICKEGKFYMANLAVYLAFSVNGVAKLHTQILQEEVFRTAYRYFPQKFNNKTNGITHRRWLELCNRELSRLIDKKIGRSWREDIAHLSLLKDKIPQTVEEFIAVKREKKRQLFAYILQKEGKELPENMLVYAQVKRLHEYKRQLMTAFAVLLLYRKLKKGEIKNFAPSLFLFGAKSAPSYRRAKGIIKYINEIAKLVNHDTQTNGLLQVVFVTDYNVSYAEKIVAGADVSLQVSTAGLEASGTGNMKFMMNGAVTCGTLDGANIEIVQHAGKENNYIFGATAEEISALKATYQPKKTPLTSVCESLIDGSFSDGETGLFQEIYDSLLREGDKYFVLHDLPAYIEALLRVNQDSQNALEFAQKQLANTASSAYFSSDRTVLEYNEDIWRI